MNVKCSRAALCEALQLASSIVPARTPKPVLQCARIQADQQDQKLTVTATDGEITIKYIVPQVQIVSSGVAVVPAERLASILRESADETVDLEVTDATCQVVGRDSRFHVFGHDPNDFPVVAPLERDGHLKIKAAMLRRMITQTTFAAAKESTRYAINGVLWEHQGKKLRMVATDGRRLARADGELAASEKEGDQSVIVPVKTLQLIERLLSDPDEKIQVSFTGNQINLCTALAEVVGNLVQGRFPKYSDVIPTGCDKKAQVEIEPFRSAVRRAALLTNEQSKGIHLVFDDGKLCLSSSTPEAGDAEITMKAGYKDAKFEIGFNPQYLLDMLRVIDEPELICEFTEGSKPGLIRAGKDFLYVIMPVTV
jgi:DNA polymerase III subunit beta